jgi:DNA polymerase III subunit alpha
MKYASLHSHSMFSFKDGTGTPDAHAERLAELGAGVLCFTEHGNISGGVAQEKAAKAHGLKAIYGCELYTANTRTQFKWHLSVLAASERGYRNLSGLVSASYRNFHYWPTTTMSMLREHAEDLIVLSGCADSKLACDLLGGKGVEAHAPDYRAALATAAKFRDLLGDRYYLEVQAFPELERTGVLNTHYARISRELGIPLVATSDVHYPNPDDNEIQKILHTIGRGKGTVSVAEAEWEYDIRLTYPESDAMVIDRLRGTGLSKRAAEAAVAASAEIAERCASYELPRAEPLRYPVEDAIETFWEWLRIGWRYRAQHDRRFRRGVDPEFWNRAHTAVGYETSLIITKEFVDYILVLADIIQWAKNQGVAVGPGRGSAAASLVMYLLRITEVNPLDHPAMMFERFIDPSRDDFPDVDLDFPDDRRDEIRRYAIGRYGEANVGNVANITRFRGKSAVTGVAMAYNIPPWETAPLRDRLEVRPEGDDRENDTISDAVAIFPEAAAVLTTWPELEIARKLEGQARSLDVHAAGLVISTGTPLSDVCATYERTIGKGRTARTVTQIAYDKRDCEYLNILKFDFLGLKTMGMIAHCLTMIGMDLDDLYGLALDDPDTLAAFTRADVTGIFQFEGSTTKSITREVKPTRFAQLADINALSRPGALLGGSTEAYIRAKNTGEWEPFHPAIDHHVDYTYGQIVYQEQYLAIVRDLAGFQPSEVGDIRRAIGKKKGLAEFNKLRDRFASGALANGASETTVNRIWTSILAASGYSFNIAHSASYAVLAYWSQWLKVHHPHEFFTASLVRADKDAWIRLVRDARAHDVRVRGVDLSESRGTWELIGASAHRANDRMTVHHSPYIRAGWSQVDGIAEQTTEAIAAYLASNPGFERWQDLAKVKGIGPKTVRNVQAAAQANDPAGVRMITRALTNARRLVDADRQFPLPTHTSSTFPDRAHEGIVWLGLVASVETIDEAEAQRKRTGESIDDIVATMDRPHKRTSARIRAYDDGDDTITIRINRWKFPAFKDDVERLRPGMFVLVKGDRKAGLYKTLHITELWILTQRPDDW